MMPLLLAGLMVLSAAVDAVAQSPLVGELRRVSLRYHEDPARLDTLREGLEQAAASDPRPENLVALGRSLFDHEVQPTLARLARVAWTAFRG